MTPLRAECRPQVAIQPCTRRIAQCQIAERVLLLKAATLTRVFVLVVAALPRLSET
jgi:hypothetical protein